MVLLLIVIVFGTLSAQPKYDSIGQFYEYQNNWAIVKLDNKLGFINSKGKEIVKPIYDSIGQFYEYQNNWALVIINNKQGFINTKGDFIPKDD